MFVIIKPVEACKGFFKSRRLQSAVNASTAEIIRTDGLPFAVLEVYNGKRGICWRSVREKCGRFASRIIAPDSVIIPENQGISRFVPSYFPSLETINTAVEILKSASLSPDSFNLSFCDFDGRFSSELKRFVPFCSVIKVVTQRLEKYVSVCTDILEKTGASVIIRSEFEKSSSRDAVIFCSGNKNDISCADIVFTADNSVRGKVTVLGSGITLLPEHKELTSGGISDALLAGAITELCNSHAYYSSTFERIDIIRRTNNSAFSDLISALSQSDN